MIPTPDLSHLTQEDFKHVYEPAGVFFRHCRKRIGLTVDKKTSEDTFLLLDALEHDAEELLALHPTVCLEIGYLTHMSTSTVILTFI